MPARKQQRDFVSEACGRALWWEQVLRKQLHLRQPDAGKTANALVLLYNELAVRVMQRKQYKLAQKLLERSQQILFPGASDVFV